VLIGEDRGVRLYQDVLARVLTDENEVETQGGARLGYDVLVLALGARPAEALRGALTVRGSQDAPRIRRLVHALREGTIRRVAFVVPAGTAWTLPLYELALQMAVAVRGASSGIELSLVAPEASPLAAFGADASQAIGKLLTDRGVALHAGATVEEVVGGRIWMGALGRTGPRAHGRSAGPAAADHGCRSVKTRATPVQHLADGDTFVVVAVDAGAPHPPAWYLNLRADPHARSLERAARKAQHDLPLSNLVAATPKTPRQGSSPSAPPQKPCPRRVFGVSRASPSAAA
jgi:hypothetical protein